jgi:hypothetical protein
MISPALGTLLSRSDPAASHAHPLVAFILAVEALSCASWRRLDRQ